MAKSDVTIIKAVSVSSHYYPDTMTTKISVSYSINDEPKITDSVNITDKALIAGTADDITNLIVSRFDAIWQSKPDEIRKTLLDYVVESLSQTYSDVKNWSTMFGIKHNSTFASGEYVSTTTTAQFHGDGSIDGQSVSFMARSLPGVQAMLSHPCGCYPESGKFSLFEIIMHLNDRCEWSREKIADWIDELHDKGIINAEFEVPDNRTDEEKVADLVAEKMSNGIASLKHPMVDLGDAVDAATMSIKGLKELLNDNTDTD